MTQTGRQAWEKAQGLRRLPIKRSDVLDFNSTGEGQLAAKNGQTVTVYPRLSTPNLRNQVNDAKRRGLTILAVALYNCSYEYVYNWRATLQHRSWLGCKLEMARRPGEYAGTQHAILMPAKERTYTLAAFKLLLLGSG